MAASTQHLSLCRQVNSLLCKLRVSNFVQTSVRIRYCSTKESAGGIEDDKTDIDAELEAEVMAIRDVSGLPLHLKRRMKNEIPKVSLSKKDHGHSIKSFKHSWAFQKRLYAQFGEGSNIDPRRLWPNKSELRMKIADEKELEIDFHKAMAQIQHEKQAEENKLMKREETVKNNLKKMEKMIADFKQKERKMEVELEEKKLKAKRRMEEAKEFLGYMPARNDPKLKAFLERKAEEDKVAEKERKKKAKEEKRQNKQKV